MKKTILCTVIGSVFSLSASAAVLDVQGEIQLNGLTAIEAVDLDKYEAAGQLTQTYTAYGCLRDYQGVQTEDCGTFTKTITLTTDGENHEEEIEEVRDHHYNLVVRNVYVKNGDQYSSTGEVYHKTTHWEEKYWADVNGDPILINGQPATEGMPQGECDNWEPTADQDICNETFWNPDLENGDQKLGGDTPAVSVSKWSSSDTTVYLQKRTDRAVVVGLPAVSVKQQSNQQGSYESWLEVEGKEGRVDYHQDSHNNPNPTVYHSTYTVVAKLPTYKGYSDCIVGENGDYSEIKCAGKGRVYFAEEKNNEGMFAPDGKMMTWTLSQE